MKTLAELQDTFQRAILSGDDAVLAEIVDTSKERREVLFSVYRNAYTLRLVEVLSNDYEHLKAYMGDAPFDLMARTYILHNPSGTPNARWYGGRLPEFLRIHSPYKEQAELGELAALENALNDVFDAADDPALTLEDLAGLAPEDWPALTLAPHPAVRRLNLRTNATDIWTALKDGETPPPVRFAGETHQVLVYRPDAQAMFRPLSSEEAMMWDEAVRGVRFSVLCEMIAMFGEDEAPMRAAGHLKTWIETGLLAKPA